MYLHVVDKNLGMNVTVEHYMDIGYKKLFLAIVYNGSRIA